MICEVRSCVPVSLVASSSRRSSSRHIPQTTEQNVTDMTSGVSDYSTRSTSQSSRSASGTLTVTGTSTFIIAPTYIQWFRSSNKNQNRIYLKYKSEKQAKTLSGACNEIIIFEHT